MKEEPTKQKSAAKARRRAVALEGFKNAQERIGPIKKKMGLFAITRGQFSMIDVIQHCVESIGPCEVSVWTWAISDYDVEAFEWFLLTNQLTGACLMIDRSAEQRNPELIDRWRETYGAGSVKVCASHAKIATLRNDVWKLLCRGSMNLNYNPRFEQLDITEGGDDFDLVKRVEEELPMLPPMSSSRDSRIASKLEFAFDMTALKPFESMKTWQK